MIELQKRVKEKFNKLQFHEESHTYQVEGKPHPSVSKLIEGFVDKPDFNKIAGFIAQRDGLNKEDILAEWKAVNLESTERGSRVHLFGEGDMLSPELDQEFALVKFWEELDKSRYQVICKEIQMHHFDKKYAGTSDLLLYDNWTHTFIIADYKTNADLFKNYKGKTLLQPFDFLEDNPYNKYQIQLSLYQMMVEQLGIMVSERWVIWLTMDRNYKIYKTYDLTEQLKEYIES